VRLVASLPLIAVCLLAAAACGSGGSKAPRTLRSLESSLDRAAAAGRFSGVVLVAKDGRPVLSRAYGIADRRSGARIRLDTRFNLASLGKPFTAVAVARLVEDGKLRFGETIGRFLPELPRRIGDRVTVAELLDHTSGLGDFFASPDYARLRPRLTSLGRYLPLIADAPPVAAPGAGFHYSNSGYILLGLIVERVSGRDYYDFLRSEVFRRAGMTSSGCPRRNHLGPRTAIGYTQAPGLPGLQPNTASLPPRGTSAGGCYSTAPDLLRFANALVRHHLLDAALTKTVTSAKVDVGRLGKYGYGFGLRYGRPGEPPTIWHNGGSPGVGAELDISAARRYTVVVLANRDYPAIASVIDRILNALRIP
jgi:CubicO group peptidase (beta-lactamase class C family)